MSKAIVNDDGIDRRGFLRCMAWAGTGVVWTIAGGVPTSRAFGQKAPADSKGDLSFVQISDSHIGFNKPANPNVNGTLQVAVDKINALPNAPLVHYPYGRPDAPGKGLGVRYCGSDSEGRKSEAAFLRAGRA